jgi:hypothetical protein
MKDLPFNISHGMETLRQEVLEKITPGNFAPALQVARVHDMRDIERKILHQVTRDNWLDMLRLSQEYNLKELQKEVLKLVSNCLEDLGAGLDLGVSDIELEKTLCNCVTSQNCTYLLTMSREHKLVKLRDVAYKHLCAVFGEFVRSGEIIYLTEEDFVRILERDAILNRNEDQVFTALQKWVRGGEEREAKFIHLLSHVRLQKMTKKFVDEVVINEDLMDVRCMKMLWQAVKISTAADIPKPSRHTSTSTDNNSVSCKAVGTPTPDIKNASTSTECELCCSNAAIPVHTSREVLQSVVARAMRTSMMNHRIVVGDNGGNLMEFANNQWKSFESPPKSFKETHGCKCPGGFVFTGGKKNECCNQ